MATLGGHGFGAKVALATAINNMDRCTGVINLDGGPLDHRYYEAYQELESYVKLANEMPIEKMDYNQAVKYLDKIECKKWASIFKQNLEDKGGSVVWASNLTDLCANMKKLHPDVAIWSQSYGLWPGQALAIFAAHSRWVHLSTNTLQFYNVIPRLQGKFPGHINTHAGDFEGPMNHWLHEGPDDDHIWSLSQKMWRWLKWHDGCHVLLADKTEAGWYYLPDRGVDRKQILLMVNSLLNMFTITIYTLMLMRNREQLEVFKEPIPVNSCQEENSVMKADGDNMTITLNQLLTLYLFKLKDEIKRIKTSQFILTLYLT